MSTFTYLAYGLNIASDLECPELARAAGADAALPDGFTSETAFKMIQQVMAAQEIPNLSTGGDASVNNLANNEARSNQSAKEGRNK